MSDYAPLARLDSGYEHCHVVVVAMNQLAFVLPEPKLGQCEAILQWLRKGNTLTPAQAYSMFGTLALHSRAAELRKEGHPVNCVLLSISGKRVGCYSLPESHIQR